MIKRPQSILYRIICLHLLALAGISVAILAAAYFLLNATVNDFEERMLRDHAVSVSRHITFENGHWSLRLPPDLLAIYSRGFGGYVLAVIRGDGEIIYSSLPNNNAFLKAASRPTRSTFSHQAIGNSIYYSVTMPVTAKGRSVWVQVGQNLSNPDVIVDDVAARFLGRIVWLVIPIFAILLLIDVILMRRLLKPISDASHVAATIAPEKPLQRLPTDKLPREVLPLANAVNQALERLERALQSQREFTADAAHELRTPLAILRTRVDTMLDHGAARELQADIDVLGHILDQLLELAELEGATVGSWEPTDLNVLCADVVSLMAPIALAEKKSLELASWRDPVTSFCNPEMLSRAIRNLIENAIRHSPPGKDTVVQVEAPATIRVKDRGNGIAPSDRDLVFQRFWRKDRQNKGSGLGLAIVAKIVQVHDGSVSISERRGGGCVFAINLPADQTAPVRRVST